MTAAIRIVVALAVLVPYTLARGHQGWLETFAVAFVAFGAGHLAAYIYRRKRPHAEGEGPSLVAKVLLTGTVVVGSLGFLVYSGGASASGYRMVDKLMTEPDRWVDREMKIHGHVEAGTIVEKVEDQTTRRRFVLQKGGRSITVIHEGPVPDTFKDQSEVVASGTLRKRPDGRYEFEATELMAKCPSKYEGAESNRKLGERPTYTP
jgi:cytochrome c-type biogenesis protein CcmE